jgi:hypothetical protein
MSYPMSYLKFIVLLLALPIVTMGSPAAFCSPLLQGNVTEERRLPLPNWQRDILPTLAPGKAWDDSMLPKSFTEALWVKIPNWLAGVWQTSGQSNNYAVVNGQLAYQGTTNVNATQTYGEQVDRSGAIWDLLRYPSTRTTETPTTVGFFVSLGPGTMSAARPGQYVRESSSIEIIVDKTSRAIQSVKNRRDRFTITLGKDGTLLDNDEVIDPSTGYTSLVLQTRDIRIQPFTVVNIGPTTGFNVQQSFRTFLTKNGMANLIPIQ